MKLLKQVWPAIVCLTAFGIVETGCSKTEELDPCFGVSCNEHGTCKAVGQQAVCSCDSEFFLTPDKIHCSPQDTCLNVSCGGHGNCQLANDKSPFCVCDSGFMPTPDKLNCVSSLSPCLATDCGNLGTCQEYADGSPYCACYDGYHLDPADPYSCVSYPCQLLGEDCTSDDQCCDGWCLKFGSTSTGYCSKRDCGGNNACNNQASDGKTMCCVDFGGDNFICLKTGSGCSCGEQKGTCGASCTCRMDSACAPGYPCLSGGENDPGATCSMICITDNDCMGCLDAQHPELVFTCQTISGGQTYCLAERGGCSSSLDCSSPDVCIPFSNAAGTGFQPSCQNRGELPTGAVCNENADPSTSPASQVCAGIYCLNKRCSEVCQFASDCPDEKLHCGIINFRMAGDATASITMCQWFDTTTECQSDKDCGPGQMCSYYASPDIVTHKLCTAQNCDPADTNNCTGPNGDCSGDNPPCYNGLCLSGGDTEAAYCSPLCEKSSDCPMGMLCGLLLVAEEGQNQATTGACIQFNGTGKPCNGPADCEATNEVCNFIGDASGVLLQICSAKAEGCGGIGAECGTEDKCCETKLFGQADNDFCMTDSNDVNFCSEACSTSESCGPGFVCGGFQFQGDPGTYGACMPADGSAATCHSDADCTVAGEVCQLNVLPNGNPETICLKAVDGGGGLGADCSTDTPCANDLCLTSGKCSTICSEDLDCSSVASGYICGRISVSETTYVGACLEAGGSATPCSHNDDCTFAEEACNYWPRADGSFSSLCQLGARCTPENACATNADCSACGNVIPECRFFKDVDSGFVVRFCSAKPANSPLCSMCNDDVDCGAGGNIKCITSSANPGEKYCGLACTQGGNECPTGNTCTQFGAIWSCKPNSDTCVPE